MMSLALSAALQQLLSGTAPLAKSRPDGPMFLQEGTHHKPGSVNHER